MASFRKLPNGRIRAEVRHRKPDLYWSDNFSSMGAARAKAAEVEAEWYAGKRGGIPNKTFGQLLERYSSEESSGKRSAKWEQARIAFLLSDPLAAIRLPELDVTHVNAWKLRRMALVSGATVNRDWNLLSAACNHAMKEWRWLTANPFSSVRRPKDSPPRDRLPTDAEIEALRVASGYHEGQLVRVEQRVFAAFLFAVETGMRSGEICALSDVRGRVAYLPVTKNGDAREVPLSPEAVRIWKQLGGFNLTDSQRDAVWRKLRAKAGIEGLHFHDSRHLAITRLAQSRKLDILELAKMIGHRNIKELMTYFNPTADDIAGKL